MKYPDERVRELQEPQVKQDQTREDISLILVEHNELVRHGLRYMLESIEGREVVGECASTEEAFSMIAMPRPDIAQPSTCPGKREALKSESAVQNEKATITVGKTRSDSNSSSNWRQAS